MFYILEGLILTILAADTSGIQGRWAQELSLPFGMIAANIWIAVPVLFILLAIHPIRKLLGRWQHALHFVALGCILLPLWIFFSQTNQIRLAAFPSREASKEIRERFRGQVMIVGGSAGAQAYLLNTLDRDEVAEAIFALDPGTKPDTYKD